MKICVLGLGVIGTVYGCVFHQAGHSVEHLLRPGAASPAPLAVHLLDGRDDPRGVETDLTYPVVSARPGTDYDLILLSVAQGALRSAVEAVSAARLTGPLLLFCNFWNDRAQIDAMTGGRPYVIGFPTAGGRRGPGGLEGALFDHVMLEGREKAGIAGYDDLTALLESCRLKAEVPWDMVEWIWLHMAINAGVTSTAARTGRLEDPQQLALDLMGDAGALAEAVRTIRETVQVVAARGADLSRYRGELLPYRLPAALAGGLMRRMFARNELTRRIMTLHSDVPDILYSSNCVYDTARELGLELPRYYEKMDRIRRAAGL